MAPFSRVGTVNSDHCAVHDVSASEGSKDRVGEDRLRIIITGETQLRGG